MHQFVMDLLLVITLMGLKLAGVFSLKVTCDYRTEVCNCGIPEDNICEFMFEIEHLQTFTKYQVNEDGLRGNAGRVWYIDTAGEFQSHTDPDNGRCKQITDTCTEAFTVDSYTFRSVIAVNGRFPGPTLIVNKDNYVKVKVANKLASESISIHWHGMHQRNTHWMDGVEGVTQCGILPAASFTYIFQAEQTGTHWYHSHSGAQRTEGLFGALIVKENETRMFDVMKKVGKFEDLPGNHTLTFLDWQDENSIDLFTQIHSNIRFFNADSVPNNDIDPPLRTYSSDLAEVGPVSYWSGLINGKGKHEMVDYTQSRLSIFTVQPNKVYRFRLIGAQSLYAYRVSIDEHKLTVIASDGAFVEPVEVDYIIIHSGERYDFLLNTTIDNQEYNLKSNFMIRAETLQTYEDEKGETSIPMTKRGTVEAILHYESGGVKPISTMYQSIKDSSVKVTCDDVSPCVALNCPFMNYSPSDFISCIHVHKLRTMFPLSVANGLPDVQLSGTQDLFFNFGFEGSQSTSAINARNLKLPAVPLSQLLSDTAKEKEVEFCRRLSDPEVCDNVVGDDDVISPECACTHVVNINTLEPVQLVISAIAPPENTRNAQFAHPVHLHGHYFHVVDMQFGKYTDGKLDELNDDIQCSGSNLCTKPTWRSQTTNDESIRKKKYSEMIKTAPLKDTILIPYGGYAVVYFKPNNPGYWFLHCHLEVHQLEGMGVIINESVSEAVSPPEEIPRCGNFDFDVEKFKATRAGTIMATTMEAQSCTQWTSHAIGFAVGFGLASFFLCVTCIWAIVVSIVLCNQ